MHIICSGVTGKMLAWEAVSWKVIQQIHFNNQLQLDKIKIFIEKIVEVSRNPI